MSTQFDRGFRDGYDGHASMYDERRFSGDSRRERYAAAERELILQLVQPATAMRILDVGTGTGRAAHALAETSESQVVGVDLSTGMLREAARKRAAAGMTFPAYAAANARALPFRRDTFDAVICIRVLHLFPPVHWGALVDEMLRVLRPGGKLLVEFDSPMAGFGWSMAREALWRIRGNRPRYYIWPQNVEPLFAGTTERELHGFWFPGIGTLAERGGPLRSALRLSHLQPPFGYLGNKLLVLARKASDP